MWDENKEGCICQGCGKNYKIDLIIPDYLWEKIRPKGKPLSAGMLCGCCIMERLEKRGRFGSLQCFQYHQGIVFDNEEEDTTTNGNNK